MSGTVLSGSVPSFTQTLTGYRVVETRVRDSLQRIALREMGSAALWYDIAAINKLVPPYLVDDQTLVAPGVLLAGEATLRVPSTAPQASGVVSSQSVFGSDCALTNGRLQAGPNGDFLIVSGEDNLKQALRIRLGTHPADLVYHPTYGCKAYTLLGKGGTPVADQLAAAFVAAAINADPRILRAESTKASTIGDALVATAIAIPINGKRLPISVGAGG